MLERGGPFKLVMWLTLIVDSRMDCKQQEQEETNQMGKRGTRRNAGSVEARLAVRKRESSEHNSKAALLFMGDTSPGTLHFHFQR